MMTVVQRCSVEKVFLEISQNLQENACARGSFLIKLQACSGGCFWKFLLFQKSKNFMTPWIQTEFFIGFWKIVNFESPFCWK